MHVVTIDNITGVVGSKDRVPMHARAIPRKMSSPHAC